MRTSSRGTLAEVKRQLSAKADPNAQDASGWTALMYASLAEQPEIMQALLDAGAHPNLRSHRDQTAIMAVVTASSSLEEKVTMLRAAGGDINAQDGDGQTALMLAADGFDPLKIVPILLREGARKDLRDARGHTVLERLEAKAKRRSVQQDEYETLRQLLVD
jgi:ankyrin repeat protein